MSTASKSAAVRPRSPGFLIRRLQQVATSIFVQTLLDFGLTPLQYTILTIVRTSPGVDQVTIAANSVLDASTVTNVLMRLEERGLVTRETRLDDRRKRVVRMTAAGSRLLNAVQPSIELSRRKLMAPLTPVEAKVLVGLVEKLLEGHEDKHAAGVEPWRRLKQTD